MAGREDGYFLEVPGGFHRQWIQDRDSFYLVVEQFKAKGFIVVCGENIHNFPSHPKSAPRKVDVVSFVPHVYETRQDLFPSDLLIFVKTGEHISVCLGGAEAEDAGNGCYHHGVGPGQQRTGGRVPQTIDNLVDGTVFLDICVGLGQVGFRLVIVIVRDKILNRVFREKTFEFVEKLGSEGFVWRDHQGWSFGTLNHVGKGEGLAGPRHTQQDLFAASLQEASGQVINGGGLISAGRVV